MKLPGALSQYIPFDKSWLMRLGILDLIHGSDETILFLEKQKNLGTDLEALLRASKQWRKDESIDVGESGTLFRFLQFAAWHNGEERVFIKTGTLKDRKIVGDASIINLSLAELLKLDNGTSQWASAAVLLGNTETPPQPVPFKLQLTYEAVEHWKEAQKAGRPWTVHKDQTITRQAEAYVAWKQTGVMNFQPEQAEDYCFARAFELMTPEEGEARWPSLRQHESDRIVSMEEALTQSVVDWADHRVVQAIVMLKGDSVAYVHPDCVSKSWPEFWQFLAAGNLL